MMLHNPRSPHYGIHRVHLLSRPRHDGLAIPALLVTGEPFDGGRCPFRRAMSARPPTRWRRTSRWFDVWEPGMPLDAEQGSGQATGTLGRINETRHGSDRWAEDYALLRRLKVHYSHPGVEEKGRLARGRHSGGR